MTKHFHFAAFLAVLLVFAGCKKDSEPAGPSANEQAYMNADGIKGGLSFDKFWATEAGFDQTNASALAIFNANSDFFRCKQCHGWDLQGRTGKYINRAPKTTRPNVAPINLHQVAATHTADDLFEAIKNGDSPSLRRALSTDLSTYDPTTNSTEGDKMPNFGEFMSDAQIWNLVKFLKEEAVDVTQLYDLTTTGTYPTGSSTISNLGKDGNAAAGDTFYATKCSACHGATGTTLLVDGGYTIGAHVRSHPHEDQHKVKFGNPGTAMQATGPTLQDLKDLYKAMNDTTKYPNS